MLPVAHPLPFLLELVATQAVCPSGIRTAGIAPIYRKPNEVQFPNRIFVPPQDRLLMNALEIAFRRLFHLACFCRAHLLALMCRLPAPLLFLSAVKASPIFSLF